MARHSEVKRGIQELYTLPLIRKCMNWSILQLKMVRSCGHLISGEISATKISSHWLLHLADNI